MTKLEKIKGLLSLSINETENIDGIVYLEIPLVQSAFDYAFNCSQVDIISSVYEIIYKDSPRERAFVSWDDLPSTMKQGAIDTFRVSINLKILRQQGVHIYFDEKELVEICPIAPEKFIIVRLGLNGNKCTICPEEYNRNEILRYNQIKKIWELLSSCSDYQNGRELIFLFKQKISFSLIYSIDDLGFEFDGFARLEKIFSDELHVDAKRHIMQNTLYSFLWRTPKDDAFRKLLLDFTLFTLAFEENYRSFSVGFSFDKIRKEYTERFREYISKLNGIMYDTLTRALAIPITGLISFVAMNGGFNESSLIINFSALMLTLFSTASMHFLVCSQFHIVNITIEEYHSLFKSIRDELNTLELIELGKKEDQLNAQSGVTFGVLRFVYAISICNLMVNGVMFFITSF
jgi:hypothetical protein